MVGTRAARWIAAVCGVAVVAAVIAAVAIGGHRTERGHALVRAHGTARAHRAARLPLLGHADRRPTRHRPHEAALASLRTGDVLHYEPGDAADLLDVTMPAYPAAPGDSPWVLLIHGGSWLQGGPAGMVESAHIVAEHGYVAFSLNYPLVGDGTTDEQQFASVVRSWRWIVAHADTLGIDPSRGAAWGFSAGGQLAAMLGNQVRGVRAVVSLSGVLEPALVALVGEHDAFAAPTHQLFLHMEYRILRARWNPFDADDVAFWRDFSPQTYLTRSGPPTFVAQGLADAVVPIATAELYGAALAAHGIAHEVVLLPGVHHDEVQDVAAAGARAVAWLDRYDTAAETARPVTAG